jgi:transposase
VAATEARIEIVGERRRVHDGAFRARVVEECSVPGARMRDLARRHGICTSLIYRWRRSARPLGTAVAAVRSDAAGPIRPGQPMVADPPLEFVPIGVLGRSEEGGSGLVAGSSSAAVALSSPGHAPLPRPAMDERPGVIEIDLADGTRLRVDAFVNERALRRVLAVLRTAS